MTTGQKRNYKAANQRRKQVILHNIKNAANKADRTYYAHLPIVQTRKERR